MITYGHNSWFEATSSLLHESILGIVQHEIYVGRRVSDMVVVIMTRFVIVWNAIRRWSVSVRCIWSHNGCTSRAVLRGEGRG